MADKKLVLRGAYTISSFMEGTGTNLRLTTESAVRIPSSKPTYQCSPEQSARLARSIRD